MLQGIRKSLTLKWMIFSVLLATIPLSIAGFSIIQIYQKDLKKSVIGIEEMKASTVVERTEAFFEKITSNLFTLVNDEDFRIRHSSSHVKNLLENLIYQNDYIWELALLDKRGKEVMKVSKYRVIGPDDLESQAKSEMFGAASKGKTYYGDFYLTKDVVPTMEIAVPVDEYKREPVGVLSVKIHLRYLWNLVPQIQIGKEGVTYVVDKEGNLIAHPDTRRVLLGLNVRSLPVVDQIVSGKEGHLEFDHPEGERVLCAYKLIKKLGWGVIVQVPVKEAYAPIRKVVQTAFIWILIGLATAVMLSLFLVKKFTLPIKRLSNGMGEIAKGSLDTYLQPTTKDEVGLLTESYNLMIRDLKQSREALKEAEESYRRIFEKSKDMVYITSVDGEFIDVNQAGVEMLGYASKKELREMNARDLYLHPDGRARFQKEVEQNGFVKDFEIKLRKRDGTPFDCLITATARKDGEDHIIGYEGFIKDISDRKRMEEELVQSKKELQTLYDLSKLVNQSLDLNEVLSISLDRAMALAGFEMGGIYLLQEDGEAFEFKYHKGFGPCFVENVRFLKFGDGICGKAIKLKQTIGLSIDEYPAPELLPFLREEGIQSLISIPLLAKEKPIGAVNLASRSPHLITPEEINLLGSLGNQIGLALENAQLFSNVAKAKSEWETTFDAVTDLITIRDKDYRIIRANVSAFKRFGLRPEEMIGKRCYETLHQSNKPCEGCYVTEALKTKKPASGERDSKYLNGIFQYFTFPVYDEAGEVVAVVDLAREITEEKRTQMEKEIVNRVNRIFASSLDLKQGIRSVYAELKKILDCERMTIALFDEDGKGFRYFALEKDYGAGELVGDVFYPMQGTRFEKMAKSGEPEIVGNTEIDSWIGRKLLQEERIRSVLLFPLEYKGKIFGTVNFGSTKLKHFSGDQFNLLRQIAPGLAIFIQNTLLFREIKGSEEKYRTVVESAIDGVCVVGGDYQFKYVNERLTEILGYSKEELIGTDLRDFLDEENRALLTDREDRRKQGIKSSPRFELNMLRKDGKVRNAEISASAIKDSKGSVNIIVFLKDITDRKQAEEALRQSEEKARQLSQENATVAEIGRIISSTLNIEEVYERFAEEVRKIVPFDRVSVNTINPDRISITIAYTFGVKVEDIPAGTVLPLDDLLNESIITKRSSFIIQARDENEVALHSPNFVRHFRVGLRSMMAVPLISKDEVIGILHIQSLKPHAYTESDVRMAEKVGNQIAGAIANAQLYFERRQVEEALRRSEERYRTILEDIQEGYFEVDLAGNFTFVNDAQCRNLGYPKEELIGMNNRQYMDKENAKKVFENFNQLYRTGEPGRVPDYEVIRKDGTKAFSEISVSLIRDSEGKQIGFRGISRDVTERKRMEEQLLQAEKLRAVGEMASGVAHDFNNALAAILGNTQLLLYTAHDEELKETLKIIEKVAKDSGQTVRRLQDFTRRRVDQELFKVDVNAIIRDSIEMTKPKWKDEPQSRGVRIEVISNPEEIPSVSGNGSELREVITNMIFNAIEAMPEGGKIEIRTFKKRRDVFIQISDSGIGIAEEAERKIFEPFFTTKPFTNTGLGLSMSYGIIKRFGGEIEVESKVGQGTTFTIILPVGGEEKEEAVSLQPIKKGREARILVIDDDEFVRNVLSRTFAQADHQVTLAENGEKGVQVFKEGKFDIVLTDLGMPGMSGWEVCRIIKEINPQIPVGMITGWGVDKNRNEVEGCDLDFFISKPFDFNQILNMVSETMASKEE